MLINVTTFEHLLRSKSMTQADLATRARVGVKTVGRIRSGKELRQSNAEKVAVALGVTLEILQSPPNLKLEHDASKRGGLQRMVADLPGDVINALTLTSLHYKVSEKAILEAGPYLFTILAELSLMRRRTMLEAWKKSILEAASAGPANQMASIGYITEEISDVYDAERKSIEERDLAGGFEGMHPEYPTESEPSHPFLAMLSDLAAEAGLEMNFEEGTSEKITPLFSAQHWEMTTEFVNPEGSDASTFDDERWSILHGIIALRDMPPELLRSGTGDKRRAWITSHPNFRPHQYNYIEDGKDQPALLDGVEVVAGDEDA